MLNIFVDGEGYESMKYKEYREILKYELYGNQKYNLINKIRIKYFQPNTNCVFLVRKMTYFFSKKWGGEHFQNLFI